MYPCPRAVIWKSPCTLLPSRLPKSLHESLTAPLSFGVFENFLFPPLPPTSPRTCPTCVSSSLWLSMAPLSSACTRCPPFPSAHWPQFVGSRFSRSPANILSPDASCTLIWMSEHCIGMTMSRLICKVWETPFSTLKCWSSWPRYHWRNSETEKIVEMRTRARVV